MFCKKCGIQLPDGAASCPKCGQAVHGEQLNNQAQPSNQVQPNNQISPNNQVQPILENLRKRFTNLQLVGMGASLLMFWSAFLSFVSAGMGFGFEETMSLKELASEMDVSFLFLLILGLNIAAGISSYFDKVALAGVCNIAAFLGACIVYVMLRMDVEKEILNVLHFSTGAYLLLAGVILSVVVLVKEIG